MTAFTTDELDRIGAAEELEVASYRADATLRPFVTIWVVRVGDDVYVRSAYGHENGWFRRAEASGSGRIRAGGIECDVEFGEPVASAGEIDAAYHAKYDRYGPKIVGTVVSEDAHSSTLRVTPRK